MSLEDQLREAAAAVNEMWTAPNAAQDRLAHLQSRLAEETTTGAAAVSSPDKASQRFAALLFNVLQKADTDTKGALETLAELVSSDLARSEPPIDLADTDERLFEPLFDLVKDVLDSDGVITLARGYVDDTWGHGLLIWVLAGLRLAGSEQSARSLADSLVRRAALGTVRDITSLLHTLTLSAQYEAIRTLLTPELIDDIDVANLSTPTFDHLIHELQAAGATSQARTLQARFDSGGAPDPGTSHGQRTSGSRRRSGDTELWLTIAEVADRLQMTTMSVYQLVHNGELHAVGADQSIRVSEQAVCDYLKSIFNGRATGS
ncbi:helix-turn-helix domain-containing protein [Streptomyces virginiae]|uniref:helix-turn-helix domain-containing protein n=1 Tax=Streptomyces virginiae TaxID=1961 RepID=UPI002255AFAB|nr:helix-turn-helix domain-containing protein [Streptomyces virginiae]MCX5278164.1 helix-turn-helix domain-containing protein [Streptomyces virginiae]